MGEEEYTSGLDRGVGGGGWAGDEVHFGMGRGTGVLYRFRSYQAENRHPLQGGVDACDLVRNLPASYSLDSRHPPSSEDVPWEEVIWHRVSFSFYIFILNFPHLRLGLHSSVPRVEVR